MSGNDNLDLLFIIWAFFFQVVLIIHFALRRGAFERYIHSFGWIVYALSIPAALISVVLLWGGKTWGFWLGGFIYLVWAIYGYFIEYIRKMKWRNPINWRIGGPYVFLYLATVMFYWFPLGQFSRELWLVYGALFIISTVLNITSHRGPGEATPTA